MPGSLAAKRLGTACRRGDRATPPAEVARSVGVDQTSASFVKRSSAAASRRSMVAFDAESATSNSRKIIAHEASASLAIAFDTATMSGTVQDEWPRRRD